MSSFVKKQKIELDNPNYPGKDRRIIRIFSSFANTCKIFFDLRRELYDNFGTEGSAAETPELKNTLRLLLKDVRQGAIVVILAGRVRAIFVLINSEYESAFGDGSNWANQHILCDTPVEGGWGVAMLDDYLQLLDRMAFNEVMSDKEFVLNRRDLPMVRRDGAHCYSFAGPCTEPTSGPFLDILSLYQGEDWKDRALVTLPAKEIKIIAVPWHRKKEVAFFRGSSTGRGVVPDTNIRLRYALHFRDHPDPGVDIGITSWSKRKQIQHGKIYEQDTLFPKSNYTSMNSWGRYKYLIYIEGYSASLRYEGLMRHGSVILSIASQAYPGRSNRLWFFGLLRGIRATKLLEGGEITTEDHIIVQDPDELINVICFLKKNDNLSKKISSNCVNKINIIDSERDKFLFESIYYKKRL